ncbi:MAG: DUF1016 domain-containing protein [Planctomycetaceae bacterium]|jgi:hypothetical protein|nr:DUF1016 domain-containing protein [Planctomycetaceae bacterium]
MKKARKARVGKPAAIYERIRDILESARAGVARSVNTTQVVANWLIGREIVEEEQRGLKRAGYGEELVKELSGRLTADFGRGYSPLNLWLFKRFYVEFPQLVDSEILYALRKELPKAQSETAGRKSGAGLPIGYTVCAESWRPGRRTRARKVERKL